MSALAELIEKVNSEVEGIETIISKEELENFRLKILSRNGLLNTIIEEFKNVPADQKREFGQKINTLKNKALAKFEEWKQQLESKQSNDSKPDLTRSAHHYAAGSRHPLSIVKNEIIQIFSRIGFVLSEGPEIEDDWHNFSALNFPPEHPARDMQDTFFIEKNPDIALRTHTSSVQVRIMENNQPPMRMLAPGRVFRNEAISARAHCQFHQVEGFYIDKNVSFADLKQTLLYFAKEMFGDKTEIRLRPSYFPFTEPSAEMDISCPFCKGKGCNICKGSGWVEILGCGMIDPNVLENCNIDSKVYSGFAFGMGIERITMLKYQVNDLRLFFENDIRFLHQFTAAF